MLRKRKDYEYKYLAREKSLRHFKIDHSMMPVIKSAAAIAYGHQTPLAIQTDAVLLQGALKENALLVHLDQLCDQSQCRFVDFHL